MSSYNTFPVQGTAQKYQEILTNPEPDISTSSPITLLHNIAYAIDRMRIASSVYLTVNEVATYLDCAVSSVQNIRFKDLPTYDSPGRRLLYRREEVDRYIQSRKRISKRRSDDGLDIEASKLHMHDKNNNPAAEALALIRRGQI